MEGGPESQTQGHVAAGHRTGTGDPQVHRQELSEGRWSSETALTDDADFVNIRYHGNITE